MILLVKKFEVALPKVSILMGSLVPGAYLVIWKVVKSMRFE